MAKFVIAPHFRLQEWVAEEKGYFDAEGLDYEFRDQLIAQDGKLHDLGDKVGAYQTFERGRDCDVSCACHWTVNVAASVGPRQALRRRLFGGAGGDLRAAGIRRSAHPSDLAGRADLGRLPVGQPLLDDPGARAVSAARARSSCPSPTACCSAAWSC